MSKIKFVIYILIFVISSTLSISSALAGVEITSPSDGETVGGIIPVVVSYSGTELWPVYHVFTSVTGGYWIQPPVLSGSYTFYWDTSGTPNGTKKTIQARAVWAGSQYGAYDTITVTVNNPPPVITIVSPTNGQVISPELTTLPITVEYHNVMPNYHGIKWIKLILDSSERLVYLSTFPTSGTYTWNIDISGYSLGEHSLLAYCVDTSDKWSFSDLVTITISPQPIIPIPPDPDTYDPQHPEEFNQKFNKFIQDLDAYLRDYASKNGNNEIIEALNAAKSQDPDGFIFNPTLPENVIDPSRSDPGPDGQFGTSDDGFVYYRIIFGQYLPYQNSLEMGPAALRSNFTAARNYLHECFHALNDYLIEKGLDIDPDGDWLVSRYDPTPTVKDEGERERITNDFARENNPFLKEDNQ